MKFKHLLLAGLLLGSAGMVSAQRLPDKMSAYTKLKVFQHQKNSLRSTDDKLQAFIKVNDESAWEKLRASGCDIQTQIGDIATIAIPYDAVETISQLAEIESIEAAQPMSLKMDSALKYANVLPLHEGKGLSSPYKGKGVVVGVVDVGFEFTHPNFYSEDGEEFRIKYVWDQKINKEYRTEDEILAAHYSADADTGTHGTHVTGIAAGGGFGSLYKGVAPESDMAIVASTFKDADLVNACNQIQQFAESEGKPCVINMSLGGHIGAHDGSSYCEQMLNRLTGPGRIICVSAGNEGDTPIYIEATQPSDTLYTVILRTDVSDPTVVVDIWGEGSMFDHYTVGLQMTDLNELSSSSLTPDFVFSTRTLTDIVSTETFDNGCEFTISSAVHPVNLRNNMQIQIQYPEQPIEAEGQILVLSLVPEKPGQAVQAWASYNAIFWDGGKTPLLANGRTDYTIGIPATCEDIITVGAYATKDSIINLFGQKIPYNLANKTGELAYFSSLGPTGDGRLKPDITAPGHTVVSSYNKKGIAGMEDFVVMQTGFKNESYLWGASSGTSMSCPFTTGVIALWLQANPTLTPDDIKDVFSRTAIQDQNLSYPNNIWGYGKIDAYKGLLDILGTTPTANEDIFTESPAEAVSVYAQNETIHVRWAEMPETANVRIYDMDGRLVAERQFNTVSSIDQSIPMSSTSTGVYIVKIETEDGLASRKIKL